MLVQLALCDELFFLLGKGTQSPSVIGGSFIELIDGD